MKRTVFASLAVFALMLAPVFAGPVDTKTAKCPVSGKAVNADCSSEYAGAKVYFCCGDCKDSFAKDSKKFVSKANAQLVATGQAKQVKCPLSGGDLDSATVTKVADVNVCFCCKDCKAKVESAKKGEQLKMVFSKKAFEKGFKVETADKGK